MTETKRFLGLGLICATLFLGPIKLTSAEEAGPKQNSPEAPLKLDMTDEELTAAIKKYVETNCFAVHEPTVMKLEDGTLAYSRITCDKDQDALSE